MSLIRGAWEEGSEPGDLSVKWETLGAAGKVRAALWNLCSPLPGRLVGASARVKLALCMHRIMYTISWALWNVDHGGIDAAACSEQAGAALGPVWLELLSSDDSVQNCLLIPEQCWGIHEMPAGVINSSSVLGGSAVAEGLLAWEGREQWFWDAALS